MSDIIDPSHISGALEQGVREQEQTLPLLDEWSKNTIMHTCYNYGVVENPETGNKELVAVSIKYKDIHTYAGFALSHLNSNMSYDFNSVRAALLRHNSAIKDLFQTYNSLDDDDALALIRAIDTYYTRSIKGGSYLGSTRRHVEGLMGSRREVRVRGEI